MDKSPEFEVPDEDLARDLLAFAEKFPGGALEGIEIAPSNVRIMYQNLKHFITANPEIVKIVEDTRAKLRIALENPAGQGSAEVKEEQINVLVKIVDSFREQCPRGSFPKRDQLAWRPQVPQKT